MKTLSNKRLKDAIRQHYAWSGGYEIYGITDDGALLCCDCMRKKYKQIAWSRRHKYNDGWRVIALTLDCDLDEPESCSHCNKAINEDGDTMTCIVLDPKGRGMLRYKGQNYCLFPTVEAARYDAQHNYPRSMQPDFEVIDWHEATP